MNSALNCCHLSPQDPENKTTPHAWPGNPWGVWVGAGARRPLTPLSARWGRGGSPPLEGTERGDSRWLQGSQTELLRPPGLSGPGLVKGVWGALGRCSSLLPMWRGNLRGGMAGTRERRPTLLTTSSAAGPPAAGPCWLAPGGQASHVRGHTCCSIQACPPDRGGSSGSKCAVGAEQSSCRDILDPHCPAPGPLKCGSCNSNSST